MLTQPPFPPGALDGVKVLDLSRVLAGPSCTQILGDLGADVIKVERPGKGDDTRGWGPPFVQTKDGQGTSESAYYLGANRNKRSIAIDYTSPDGKALLLDLMAKADIVVENFKTGGLAKYGLDYTDLSSRFPSLIWCSITGFGHTGPYADRAGYDIMIQATGGIMSVTGEAEREPMKVGVAIADLMAGMYATTGILAALQHRHKTGQGQHVDISLFDCQLAWLANIGQYYLTSGQLAPRMGNAHSVIVPYQVFETADGHIILAVGNDRQFASVCALADLPDLAEDPRFATNEARVRHRDECIAQVGAALQQRSTADWVTALEAERVPCAPVNTVDQAFAHPQAAAREMVTELDHPASGTRIKTISSPLRLSASPTTARHAPPANDQDRDSILSDWLDQ
ncbi:MAG: CaiB/BaiF CoA-transferase family protein [Alphaproteobacteria bacterium]